MYAYMCVYVYVCMICAYISDARMKANIPKRIIIIIIIIIITKIIIMMIIK